MLACFLCKEKDQKVLDFNTYNYERCKRMSQFRKAKKFKYADVVLQEMELEGYHVKCYRKFVVLKEMYRQEYETMFDIPKIVGSKDKNCLFCGLAQKRTGRGFQTTCRSTNLVKGSTMKKAELLEDDDLVSKIGEHDFFYYHQICRSRFVDRCKQVEMRKSLNHSMPLQQRLTAIASTSTAPEPEKPIPTLKSQPLSPTKLKVTRQSTSKPQQQQQQTPKPKPAEPEEVQAAPIREEVCLKWNTHHSNMQTAFPALLNKEQYCDVTLVAEGMSLKCHKLILSSCSAYFDQVLEKVAPYQHPIIFMKDIPFNIMKSLCDFMYVGEVNILHSDLDQILAVGESLKIKGLANKSGNNATTDKPSSIETRKVPAVKAVTSKPSNLEKNDPAEEPDITDPLDLMEPTYEEAATPDVSPAALKRNDQARKSTGKRVRKRKHVEVDHEPSPPVFRMRKGTRSRPNVKVPRYFNANFDNSVPSSEPEPSEFVQSNETQEESFNDPFMNILDEIKTEPLDIEDNFEEESYIHEMSHRETDTETYDPGPIVEETEKVLKKVRTYRGAIVAKQEKPDPLNVDQTVGTLNQAEEMEIDNSERTENQEEDYREEALPVLTGTSDGDDMQIENSEREDMEVDSELEERTVEVNEPLHLENSEDTDRQGIQLENCEQDNLPVIVNEQNETRNDELDNTTDQTQPVENSDSHIENSDTNIENSDMNIENSDMNIENSDVHIENSDMNIENSDMHIENSDMNIENSDMRIENSDTIIENSDKEEVQGNKIDIQEKLNVHISQDETRVDSCERRDMMKEDSIHVVSREESSDIIENETDNSDVQGVSRHCNDEEKTFNDSERNSENIAEETSEEKSVEDGAQELNSEETQLLPNEKLNEVSINTPVPEEFKSNDLSTTEKDPLL